MTVTRSPYGINNYPIFLDVDWVAFCEGGGDDINPSASVPPADHQCCDALFWTKTLTNQHITGTLQVLPIGSKRSVLAAFEQARGVNSGRVIFCMDADYDRLLGTLEPDDHVFYTEGYSIENDLFSEDTIGRFLRKLYPGVSTEDSRDFAQSIVSDIEFSIEKISRFIIVDITLFIVGFRAILDSTFPRYVYDNGGSARVDYCAIRRDALHQLQHRPRVGLRTTFSIVPSRDLRGHALFEILFRKLKIEFRSRYGRPLPGGKDFVKLWLCDCIGQ